jgi:catechol 2,3-dioxygenase-like lactoylglutathione lyase family enzyme
MGDLGAAPPYLRIHAVNVFVKNQARSLQFYLDQLGFDLAFDAEMRAGHRVLAVVPPDGGTVLSLISPDPDSPEYKLIGRSTQVVFVTENVPAKFAEWRKRGVRFRHTPRLRRVKFEPQEIKASPFTANQEPIWGGVFTRFEDIDGNTFTLASFDAVTQAVEA